MLTIQERTRLANQYRREAVAAGVCSPFRQSLYINARISGKSHDKAIAIARIKPEQAK